MILAIIFFVAVLIYAIFFITQFYNIIFKDYGPSLSTDKPTILKIISELKVKPGINIYELGCGQARFLKQAEKSFPQVKLVGVENSLMLYLWIKLKFLILGSKIKFINHDVLKINLSEADIIYCWLFKSTMEKLGKKIKEECKPGTQVISRSFSIPQFEPVKTLIIENKTVYFYEII